MTYLHFDLKALFFFPSQCSCIACVLSLVFLCAVCVFRCPRAVTSVPTHPCTCGPQFFAGLHLEIRILNFSCVLPFQYQKYHGTYCRAVRPPFIRFVCLCFSPGGVPHCVNLKHSSYSTRKMYYDECSARQCNGISTAVIMLGRISFLVLGWWLEEKQSFVGCFSCWCMQLCILLGATQPTFGVKFVFYFSLMHVVIFFYLRDHDVQSILVYSLCL